MPRDFLITSRHRTKFYFRRRVPDDLRAVVGKPYLVKSLGTCERRAAIILARIFATRTDALFSHLRTMNHKDDDGLTLGYVFEIEMDEFFRPKKVKLDAEPHETDAANSAIETALRGLSQNSPGTRLLIGPELPFDQALTEYYAKAKIKPNTKATYRSRLAFAQQHFGEKSNVLQIGQGEFSDYCDVVIRDVGHVTTQGHYINTFGGFLNWHRLRKSLPLLTTKTLTPVKTTPDSDDRDGFTLDQLKVLFGNARQYRDKQPHKYWITVGVAFLGCRLEELAQANLETDLHHDQEKGIWYLRLDETPDDDGATRKSIKKLSSWRWIPIHSALVEHGFIAYLLKQKEAGFSRPFECGWSPRQVTTDNGEICKWSHYIGNWGGREIKKLNESGLLTKGSLTYFHSMRHTFKAVLGEAGVSPEISEALAGRKYGGADAERYEKLKKNHRRLSVEGVEPGLGLMVAALLGGA